MELLNLLVRITVDDQASSQMDGISSGMIAKGQLIASAIQSALSAVINAIQGVVGGALDAYGQYEQLAGGIETFFGSAADSVIANSKKAYDAAGMSANQYMSTVSSFATTLVQSVAKSNQQVVQDNNAAVSKALDDAYNAQSKAFQHEMTDAQRAFEDEYNALSKSLSKQVEAMTKAASKSVTERQKQFEKDNENLTKSLNKELEAVQKEAQKVVEERQKQLDTEYGNLSKSLDSQIKEFERATNERIKLMDKEYRQRLKQLDAEKAAAMDSIDSQIDAINKLTDEEEEARKASVRSERLAELQKQLDSAKTKKGRERAQKELNDYLAEIEAERISKERKEQIEGLRDQREDIKKHYEELKSQTTEQYSSEKDAYKEQRSEQLAAMKEANAQQLALMRENQKQVLQQLREEGNAKIEAQRSANQELLQSTRESQQAELEQMRENNNERIAAQREANEELLKQTRRNQQDQLTAMRESQQDQLAAMKESIAEQKAALEDAAKANSGYVTATAEDQQRAAEIADMAVRDMADNANKTGTAMEMIQNAYQGFAKQNYTMLDNLKLGYAGTKEGMQNLLDDAERVSASYGEVRDFSIDSFADIVEAIHLMQVEMGISGLSVDELKQKMADNDFTMQELTKLSEAWYGNRDSIDAVKASIEAGGQTINDFSTLLGTTALEGSNTYEGSINRVKAAWENWLVSLTDPEWDVVESTTTLMEEVGNAAGIIIPRVEEILSTLLAYVAEHGPEMAETLKNAFLNSLPDEWRTKLEGFGKKIDEFIKQLEPLKKWLEENIPKAMKFLGDVFDSFTREDGGGKIFLDFLGGLGEILKVVAHTFFVIGNDIAVCLADLVSGFEGTENVGGTVFYNIGEFFRNCGETFERVRDTIGDVIENVSDFFGDLKGSVDEKIEDIIDFFENLPQNILDALGDLGDLLWNAGQDIINGFWDGLTNTFEDVKDWVEGIGDWIADNKGPKRYDLGLLVANGGWIMEGLEKGMRDKFPEIEKTVSDIGSLMSIDAQMGVSSASNAWRATGGAGNVLNVYVDKMQVRDDNDICRVSEQLNDMWRREMAGALA